MFYDLIPREVLLRIARTPSFNCPPRTRATYKDTAMPTRQVIPQQHFDAGGVTTLRIADQAPDSSDELHGRADRSISVNWQPERENVHRLSTIGGIAPPGTSIKGYPLGVTSTSPVRPSSFETISTHRIERRTTSARMSRILVTLIPLVSVAAWFWYRFG
jgi:hypothetical protein